jgi:hypothetical protein
LLLLAGVVYVLGPVPGRGGAPLRV